MNEILERVEADVKKEFSVGVVGSIDRIGGAAGCGGHVEGQDGPRDRVDECGSAGEPGRGVPRLRDRFFDRLDSLVRLTGRGLLVSRSAGDSLLEARMRLQRPRNVRPVELQLVGRSGDAVQSGKQRGVGDVHVVERDHRSVAHLGCPDDELRDGLLRRG